MNIRKATNLDIAKVLPLIRAFHKETLEPFGMGFDPISVEATIKLFIDQGVGLLVEKKGQIVGMIGGAVIPSFTDYSQKIFAECIWYILPKHRGGSAGIKLLKLVEDYCQNIGIKKIIMIGMCDDGIGRLAAFYNKMGYKAVEIHYIKDLTNAKDK